jgi:hypothetical protein
MNTYTLCAVYLNLSVTDAIYEVVQGCNVDICV